MPTVLCVGGPADGLRLRIPVLQHGVTFTDVECAYRVRQINTGKATHCYVAFPINMSMLNGVNKLLAGYGKTNGH